MYHSKSLPLAEAWTPNSTFRHVCCSELFSERKLRQCLGLWRGWMWYEWRESLAPKTADSRSARPHGFQTVACVTKCFGLALTRTRVTLTSQAKDVFATARHLLTSQTRGCSWMRRKWCNMVIAALYFFLICHIAPCTCGAAMQCWQFEIFDLPCQEYLWNLLISDQHRNSMHSTDFDRDQISSARKQMWQLAQPKGYLWKPTGLVMTLYQHKYTKYTLHHSANICVERKELAPAQVQKSLSRPIGFKSAEASQLRCFVHLSWMFLPRLFSCFPVFPLSFETSETSQSSAAPRTHDLMTSSTAQGGGGSFKDRKLWERCCCNAWMAERIHWWIERWLRLWVSLSPSLSLSNSLIL